MNECVNPKISVLVPCYNVEKYVSQCLESIARQTLNDIEVICINDGSKDSTLDHIRRIASADSRFVVIDKPNSGYGASVNLGITKAKGEYIAIIESDDFIESEMLERLYNESIAHDLDIARCCYSRYIDGKDQKDPCKFLPKDVTYNALEKLESFRHPPSIWAAIYRRSFLLKNNIRFLETPGASFQDISFAFKTSLMAKRVRCTDRALVHYRIHSNNSVKKASNPMVVFTEYDEALRYAESRHLKEKVLPVLLAVEYATFKWNYLRVDRRSAELFFKTWIERWRKCHGYEISLKNPKMYVYYLLITRVALVFEIYLKRKIQ